MAGTEAPHQRPEEKLKTYECQPSFCEVFSLPQSKIENRKSKILLPPPSPAFAHAPWPTALFRPFSKQIKAIQSKHFRPSKTTMHYYTLHSARFLIPATPLPALQPRTPPSFPSFASVKFSLPKSKIENRKSKILLPPPPPAA